MFQETLNEILKSYFGASIPVWATAMISLINRPDASQCFLNPSSGLIRSWLSVAAAKPLGKIEVRFVIGYSKLTSASP